MSMPIKTAQIHFNDTGTPVSTQFDDIYFSTQDGMAETQYVFLQGNDLNERLSKCTSEVFVIGETGFGTGLNFLTTWLSYQEQKQKHNGLPRLHFISFEQYPLSAQDLKTVLSRWPQLNELVQKLLQQYPAPLPGCHRLSFYQGQVTLDLWLGDIQQTLPQLNNCAQGYFDAWYLDGFAPTKNSGMWHPSVIKAIAGLSRQGATIATFTCARMVRDALTDAGFSLSKRKGFGKKREMLTGRLDDKVSFKPKIPFNFRHPNNSAKTVAIVGGGIASACLAHALAKRGYQITLYCKDHSLAQGASQNRQGALYPLLHADNSPLSEFYAHAYTYALRQYHQLLNQGFTFKHDFCGVLLQTFNDKSRERHNALINSQLWPEHIIEPKNNRQCSEIANLSLPFDGLYFPQGGWINPASLINALLKSAAQCSPVNVNLGVSIEQLKQDECNRWQIAGESFDNVIIATGHLSAGFEQTRHLALSPIRGQVSHLDSNEQLAKLSTVLCYSGYITPENDGQHCIGASFIKGDANCDIRPREHQRNLERLQDGIGNPDWLKQLNVPTEGRASIRCVSVDHLPLAGAVPDGDAYRQTYQDLYKGLKSERYGLPPDYENLYILTALGARGLCSAPLAAEIIAAQIANEPYPVSKRVLDALNPGRGLIKQLKRNKPF